MGDRLQTGDRGRSSEGGPTQAPEISEKRVYYYSSVHSRYLGYLYICSLEYREAPPTKHSATQCGQARTSNGGILVQS